MTERVTEEDLREAARVYLENLKSLGVNVDGILFGSVYSDGYMFYRNDGSGYRPLETFGGTKREVQKQLLGGLKALGMIRRGEM